jgi:iron complex outermembrane receptor protein
MYPEGFLPLENSKSTDTSLVTGLRGEASGWRWDVSLNYGQQRIQAGPRQHRQPRPESSQPTHFYAGKLKNTQSLLNVDVARDYPVEAFSGPLTVALGAEYRREEYEIGAGDVASYSGSGAQGFSGFRR